MSMDLDRLSRVQISPPLPSIVRGMRTWIPQIVIGIIVTVAGTVIADAIVGHGRHAAFGTHFAGFARHR